MRGIMIFLLKRNIKQNLNKYMAAKFELPSGRMVDVENIIYLGEIKEKSNFFTNWDTVYYFEVVWAGREKVTLTYKDEENCILDWEHLKRYILQHTTSI